MAIQKEKILKSGAIGNYWRITTVTIDRQNMKVIGKISLFKDKAASDSGKLPMNLEKTFKFTFIPSDIAPPVNLIAFAYTKIQDAVNVVITKDILGKDLQTPTTVDPDLSGGSQVL